MHLIFALLISFYSQLCLANSVSGKLLLTGGVSSIEGSAGGGITPWALIGGYGTRNEIGANAFYTKINLNDYDLESFGAMVGIYDRLELSVAHQTFNTERIGTLLGLGPGYKIEQNVFGAKLKVLGDAVLDQDNWMPQIAVGAQYKKNEEGKIVRSLGADDDKGIDYYISATKIILSQSILVNGTLRRTRANQLGILGFGGDKNDSHKYFFEGSVGYLLRRDLVVGAEYRNKPNNLKVAKEEDWYDLFLAWTPTKNISLTFAYAVAGQVAVRDNQTGLYSSIQVGF